MRKAFCTLLIIMALCSLVACGNKSSGDAMTNNSPNNPTPSPSISQVQPTEENTQEADSEPVQNADDIDVDLTKLSSTMVYSEVYNMLYYDPESYYGKAIKMNGVFSIYQMVVDGVAQPDPVAYGCIIADATACCAQGMEFVLEGDFAYPEDYPELGTEITVVGEFQPYEENGMTWYHLINARME